MSALNSLLIPPHSRFCSVCPSGILPCLKSLLMPPHSRFYSQPARLISNPDCSQSAELTLVATVLFVRSLSLFAFNTRTHVRYPNLSALSTPSHVRYPNLSAFSTPLTSCLHSIPHLTSCLHSVPSSPTPLPTPPPLSPKDEKRTDRGGGLPDMTAERFCFRIPLCTAASKTHDVT